MGHKEGKQDASMQPAALYQVPTVWHSCCVPGSVAESHTDTLPRWTDHRAQALTHNGPLPTGLLGTQVPMVTLEAAKLPFFNCFVC